MDSFATSSFSYKPEYELVTKFRYNRICVGKMLLALFGRY